MTCLVWLKIVLHDWFFCISLLINAVDPWTLSSTQVVMPKSHMLVGKLAGHFLHTYLIVQLKTPCYRCCLFSPAFFVCVTSYEGGQDALVSNRHCRPKGLLSVCSEPPPIRCFSVVVTSLPLLFGMHSSVATVLPNWIYQQWMPRGVQVGS